MTVIKIKSTSKVTFLSFVWLRRPFWHTNSLQKRDLLQKKRIFSQENPAILRSQGDGIKMTGALSSVPRCFLHHTWRSSISFISNNRLSRSQNLVPVFQHDYLATGNIILRKRGEIAPNERFSSFPQYFQQISNFRSKNAYSFVKCGCLIYFFLNSANLICWGLIYVEPYKPRHSNNRQ